MACLSFPQFTSLSRWESSWNFPPTRGFLEVSHVGMTKRWALVAISKRKVKEALSDVVPEEDVEVVEKKSSRTSKRATTSKTKKKVATEDPEIDSVMSTDGNLTDEESISAQEMSEAPKKTRKRTKKKDTADGLEEKTEVKKVVRRRRTKKQMEEDAMAQESATDNENPFIADEDDGADEEILIEEGEDISFTYTLPPLICCFGATQHAFVPSGRPANRLIDHEWHENHKDVLFEPEKFVRSPGGCASDVAVALARLGGKVAVMGKLGDDDYGQFLIYFLNINKVQTRSIRLDSQRTTGVTRMKISKRGHLRMTCVKPCPEDSLSKSEINIDVLKEAKMFYFNTFSLLDRNMRATTIQAIRIAKKLGGVIFYDLNLPLPLWQSSGETKKFIRRAWELADIIEITKQELEFLCDIKSSEKFDTKDNDSSKFTHYPPEVVSQLWHENLKVLFVTNGTSKIHYYTKEHHGSVLGMEDPPVTPYTSDMSASGDGIIAAMLKMLNAMPHLITDKKYLEHTVKYAISCGVIDQWTHARRLGYPMKEGMEDVSPDPNGIRSITEREYRTLVSVQ